VTAAIFLAPAAQAAAAEFPLEVEVSGEGNVGCKVNSGPVEGCEAEFEEGTQVTVIAEPELGSEFLEWQGDCDTATGNECEVEMNEAKTIEAVFGLEEFEVTVETEGNGEGVVECEVDGGPTELCSEAETYPYGTELNLYAEPEAGSQFLEWGGDCSGEEAECELTVEEPLGVTATFEPGPFFALNIEEPGTGEGTVECEVEGFAEPCEAEYVEGTVVTLHAEPKPGSEFVEWLGECDVLVGNECEVEVSEERTVEAVFDARPAVSLTITKAGTGTGEVKCKVNGGSAGPCAVEYSEGTELALVATASAGSEFTGFSSGTGSAGACSTSPCSFTIEANSAVTATFKLTPRTLTITEAGTGTGAVKCKFNGGSAGACTSPQPNGTSVEVSAIANAGSEFTGFSSGTGSAGACSTSPCSFTIEANSAVTATFDLEPTPEFKLTVVKAGTGSGTVTCDGGACASTYPEGEEVTLAATAASGSTFAGWSGAGCSGTAPCEVTIEEDTTVTATFNANPKEETKKEEVKPPPPTEGTAKAAGTASVKSGKASLKLSCSGGPCKGTVQLKAKVKQGKKTKNLVIGKASFNLADGASATIKVKLSGPAKQELAKGKTLKAKTSGPGITPSTVKLKPPKK
jgi:hypothetical protein